MPHTTEPLDLDDRPAIHLARLHACDLWRSISEDTDCRVVLLSTEGVILAFNSLASRILSRWTAPQVGMAYRSCFPEPLRGAVDAMVAKILDSGVGGGSVESRYLVAGYQSVSRSRAVPLSDGGVGVLMVARTVGVPVPIADVLEQVARSFSRELALGDLAPLSDRELEVAMLIAAGLTDDDISDELSRSVRTVHSHRRMIGRRMRLKTRAEIVRLMVEHGLVARVDARSSVSVERLSSRGDEDALPPIMNWVSGARPIEASPANGR